MTATGHALIGAAIGSQITNPILGLPLSLVSHFVCDKVPHWDPMTNKTTKSKQTIIIETIFDVLLGYALVALIFVLALHASDPIYIFLNAIVAQLPDWLEVPYSIFKLKIPFFYDNYRFQHWIHHIGFDSRMQAPWGVISQVAVALVFLLWAILPKS